MKYFAKKGFSISKWLLLVDTFLFNPLKYFETNYLFGPNVVGTGCLVEYQQTWASGGIDSSFVFQGELLISDFMKASFWDFFRTNFLELLIALVLTQVITHTCVIESQF